MGLGTSIGVSDHRSACFVGRGFACFTHTRVQHVNKDPRLTTEIVVTGSSAVLSATREACLVPEPVLESRRSTQAQDGARHQHASATRRACFVGRGCPCAHTQTQHTHTTHDTRHTTSPETTHISRKRLNLTCKEVPYALGVRRTASANHQLPEEELPMHTPSE
jgi:hypothetical protein